MNKLAAAPSPKEELKQGPTYLFGVTGNKYRNVCVKCFLKNNSDWYYPEKIHLLDLGAYRNVDKLSTSYHGDLYFAWDESKEDGRLFRTK